MALRMNSFQPVVNLAPEDKEQIVKEAAAAVKSDLDKAAAASAADKEELAKGIASLRVDLVKMVADEVAKQLKSPAAIAAAERLRAETEAGDEARAEKAKTEPANEPEKTAAPAA